jgi:hypothetical protein
LRPPACLTLAGSAGAETTTKDAAGMASIGIRSSPRTLWSSRGIQEHALGNRGIERLEEM